MYIAVIGAGQCDGQVAELAYRVGQLIAKRGAILVCGGLGGVMDAAAKGAKEAGGLTVGILLGPDRQGASPYLDVSIPTDMGHARNALVVRAADVVIAVGGEYGTLSEIGLALKMSRPVVGLNTWELCRQGQPVSVVEEAKTPEEAVEKAVLLAARASSLK